MYIIQISQPREVEKQQPIVKTLLFKDMIENIIRMNSKDWEAKSLMGGIYPPYPPLDPPLVVLASIR